MAKWNAGTFSEIRVRFRYKDLKKTVTYNIKSQNQSKAVTQGEVIVETAEIITTTCNLKCSNSIMQCFVRVICLTTVI